MTIVNTTRTPSALLVLAHSPFNFYLGGSRRMEEIEQEKTGIMVTSYNYKIVTNPDTDYDFYATHTPGIISFLLSSGFVETDCSKKANTLSNIYLLDDEAFAIMHKDNVQVVLRNDAAFYRAVFENISPEFYYKYLWKSSPATPDRSQIQPIFNMLFAIGRAATADTVAPDPQPHHVPENYTKGKPSCPT